MPIQSIHKRFSEIAAAALWTDDARTYEEGDPALAQLRNMLGPLYELAVRTAALAQKPLIPHRQRQRHRALVAAVNAGATDDRILQVIRQTKALCRWSTHV